ncbi:hypothetical protein H2248_000158 [Termitomyces sp. 'cryptogamus']|nr:hypothetical protein H2248_000158 [Termitomyces sp. 'cryptogamus']
MVNNTAVSIHWQVVSGNYIDLVSYTLLYYDYVLTLPAEVDRFWSTRSLSWASTFFYFNRYLSLFGHVPAIFRDFWMPESLEWTKTWASPFLYLKMVTQISVGMLLTIRTYALYDRNLRVLLFICTCEFAVIIVGVWSVVGGNNTDKISIHLQIACTPLLKRHVADRFADGWIGTLMFEVLIFTMTIYKSWRRGERVSRSLYKVLLRDGAIYFGQVTTSSLPSDPVLEILMCHCRIISAVGLVTVITFYALPGYQRGVTATFASVVQSMTMSRLMLNIRDPKYSMKLTHPTLPSALVFNVESNVVSNSVSATSHGLP